MSFAVPWLIKYDRQILKKGELQVGEKEREHDLSSLRREIATLVAEKCVDPATQRPYPVGVIEKAMNEAGFSVRQGKTAKSQVSTRPSASAPSLRTNYLYHARSRNALGPCKQSQNCPSNAPVCVYVLRCPRRTVYVYASKSLKERRRSRMMRWDKMSGKR